eukprot:7350714-Pyramimonas_sp.AAC.1
MDQKELLIPEPPAATLGATTTPERLRTGDQRFSPSQNTASFHCDECQRGPSTSFDGTWEDDDLRQRMATARTAGRREGLNCRWLCT